MDRSRFVYSGLRSMRVSRYARSAGDSVLTIISTCRHTTDGFYHDCTPGLIDMTIIGRACKQRRPAFGRGGHRDQARSAIG